MMGYGRWIGHNGAGPGYTTHLGYLPERDVGVAVAVNEFSAPPLLGVAASIIWFGFVRGHGARGCGERPAEPAVPSVADLDDRLRRTLDPAVPVAEKPLRIAGDDKDPELITRISRVYAPVTMTVVDATEVGPGQLLATTVLGSPERRVPTIVPFLARGGSWRLATGWACQTILATGESSPAGP
ncbi:hypothetical protein IU427_27530 [Nocardia beijingensis]|nr:hypothetical protein [Nocardia beijingensis]